jgi:hypothetical protein
MRALIERLSALDPDAGGAVRVISVFDRLAAESDGPTALLAATAAFTEGAVGLTVERHVLARAGTAGVVDRCAIHPVQGGGTVWLERRGPASPLDELVLERLAAAARIVLDRGHWRDAGRWVESFLREHLDPAERRRAVEQLGLRLGTPVRLLAVNGADPSVSWGPRAAVADIPDEALAVVLPENDPVPAPPGAAIGVGDVVPAAEAYRSWAQARIALRFCGSPVAGEGPTLHRDLGDLVHLTGLIVAGGPSLSDVAALDRLADARGGEGMLDVLATYCRSGSVRAAASELHLHHSSVDSRVDRAERELGFAVRDGIGRTRLHLALVLRHLAG